MSYSRTVRCGHCYKEGHNKTTCPTMREQALAKPDGWQAVQVAKYDIRKAKPKTCGYCGLDGHTRAGCDTMKGHKVLFTKDLILWRAAMSKWMKETGLGVGALVRCADASYYDGDVYRYPSDDNYIPAVGMIMENSCANLSHYHGIMNTPLWSDSAALFSFTRLGASDDVMAYRRTVAVALPCIPGIVPRFGKGYYASESLDRRDRLNNVEWEVVSPGVKEFNTDNFLCPKLTKKAVKQHFAAPQDQESRYFVTFTNMQRSQLEEYVNDRIELSEMKDPEVPVADN